MTKMCIPLLGKEKVVSWKKRQSSGLMSDSDCFWLSREKLSITSDLYFLHKLLIFLFLYLHFTVNPSSERLLALLLPLYSLLPFFSPAQSLIHLSHVAEAVSLSSSSSPSLGASFEFSALSAVLKNF